MILVRSQSHQTAVLALWVALVRMCNASMNRTLSNQVLPCPSRCNCSESDVDCQGLNLSTVPLTLSPLTTSLRMSNNKMRRLTNDSLEYLRDVRRLFLDYNHIQDVAEGTFKHSSKLQVLHLQGNNLVTLHRNVFVGLYDLQRLYLHGNALGSLDPVLFRDTPRLHILDLRANRLTSFQRSPFYHLHQLTHLNLAQNPLKLMNHDSLFASLEALQELNLGETGLRSVHRKLLLPLRVLNKLNLSRNKLTNFDVASVKPLDNLQFLNLSGNPFRCDCKIIPVYEWITNQATFKWDQFSLPKCHSPHRLKGQTLNLLSVQNFTCPRRPPPKRTTYYTTFQKQDVVNPAPLPYDRMMGWYTAATLSSMLVLFLIGVALDKAKRRFYRWRRAKRDERERLRNPPPVELKNCKPKLVPTNSVNSGRDITVADTLNHVSRQSSCDGTKLNYVSRQSSCDGTKLNYASRQSSFDGSRLNYMSRQSSYDGARVNYMSSRQSSCDGARVNYMSSRQSSCDGTRLNVMSRQSSCDGAKVNYLSRQNSYDGTRFNYASRQSSCDGTKLNYPSRQSSCDGMKLNYMSPQSACDGTRSSSADILKRNDLMPARVPLPKVEIHLAPNLHDFANFHNPQDYLKSQDILIDVSDSIEKTDSKFLLWPAHTKLNKLQKQVETSL